MNPTVSRGQQSRAAKQAAHIPAETLPPKKRPHARGVNLNWRHDFLTHYQAHGGLYAAAAYAGVNSSTVYDEMARTPEFKTATEEARQQFADSREMNLARLANEGNVVGDIVLLKKHRPAEYIEKNLSISASFTTQLDPAAGQALLATMLGHLAPQPAPMPMIDVSNPEQAQLAKQAKVLPTQAEPSQDGGH